MHGVHQSLMGILSRFHGPLSVWARQGGSERLRGGHTPTAGAGGPSTFFILPSTSTKATMLLIIYISIYQYIYHNNFKYNVDICRYLSPPVGGSVCTVHISAGPIAVIGTHWHVFTFLLI
jgi:hypothetical protein